MSIDWLRRSRYVKVKNIAKALGLRPAVVRDVMRRLEEEGYVATYIVSRDRRGRSKYKVYEVRNPEALIRELRRFLRGYV